MATYVHEYSVMTTSRRVHPAARPLAELTVGLALVLTYKVFAHYHVGEVGAPGDIGGGLIPLVGLGLLLVGIIDGLSIAVRIRRRLSR